MQKLKDKKIVIYKSGTFEDEDGFQTEGYMPIHPQASVWLILNSFRQACFMQTIRQPQKKNVYLGLTGQTLY